VALQLTKPRKHRVYSGSALSRVSAPSRALGFGLRGHALTIYALATDSAALQRVLATVYRVRLAERPLAR